MSQKQQVLRHMQRHGSITTMIAFNRYGITRLPARIPELEKQGHLINDAWIQRNGKRFKAWSLVQGRRAA